MFYVRKGQLPHQADPEIIRAFTETSTAVISDNLERLQGTNQIRPFHTCKQTMAGSAFTVRTRTGDNNIIHQALEFVRPGDVIVVDGGGDTSRALVGEIMISIARSKGAAGLVVDGAIRDLRFVSQSSFPCFARGVTHRGPYKNGPGEFNVCVSVDGMIVEPGDIVVGDEDGLVAFPQSIGAELLQSVLDQQAKEEAILASIKAGTYTGAYARQSTSS